MSRVHAIILIPLLALFASAAAAQEGDVAAMVKKWTGSPHADATAEAFTHWNEEGAVPPDCAVCHSGEGFRAFHGLDGSAAGTIEHPVPVGGVVDCDTCHTDGARAIGPIRFPSDVMLSAGPLNDTCLTCHQGRASGESIRQAVAGMEPDAVSKDLSFINPHYAAAAATLMGAEAGGMYEYDGKDYAVRFGHVEQIEGCVSCHDPHSLQVATSACADCHKTEDPRAVRVSTTDYDGDGNTTEGLWGEIETLRERLRTAMGDYAKRETGTGLVYDEGSYPYFFNDGNGNGAADPGEVTRGNAFSAWTPRLLAAAYNYQFVTKDPGAYAHNPHYAIQVLVDAIADLAPGEAKTLTRP